MNKIILLIAAICLLTFTGCDNRENVQGQWQSNPVKLDLPNTATSMATMVFTFSQDGTASISADINITEPVAQSSKTIAPYQMSISATASINGTWRYVANENDEVLMTLNPTTLAVNIDPQSVNYSIDQDNGLQAPDINTLTPAMVNKYKILLSNEMNYYFAQYSKLEDIKVHGDVMEFEVDINNAPDIHVVLNSIK